MVALVTLWMVHLFPCLERGLGSLSPLQYSSPCTNKGACKPHITFLRKKEVWEDSHWNKHLEQIFHAHGHFSKQQQHSQKFECQ